ncbi:MAG: hypothetical protein JXP34_23200 [Planctomycetes bacterium]|nr:hypothetical protein [Planctomycetota bacterium]
MLLWALLYVLGLGLLMAELFIPTGGILGVIATLGIGYSIYQIYTESAWIAALAVVTTIAYVIFLIQFWTRRLAHRGALTQEESVASDRRFDDLLGREGTALTALRPAGFADIDGARVPVVSEGKFMEKKARVRVTDVKGNRVVVTELEPPEAPDRSEPLFRRE